MCGNLRANQRYSQQAVGGPEQPSPSIPLPGLVEGSQTSVTSEVKGEVGDAKHRAGVMRSYK